LQYSINLFNRHCIDTKKLIATLLKIEEELPTRGQLSLPSLWGRNMSSNPCNYMDYGVETIKRQTRAAYGWLVVNQSVGAGLAYGI